MTFLYNTRSIDFERVELYSVNTIGKEIGMEFAFYNLLEIIEAPSRNNLASSNSPFYRQITVGLQSQCDHVIRFMSRQHPNGIIYESPFTTLSPSRSWYLRFSYDNNTQFTVTLESEILGR